VLVIVPDVAHLNVAVDEELVRPPGADVKETRGAVDVGGGGGGGGAEVTLHEYAVLALPAEFDTLTRKECVPTARPLYDFGDAHATAAALSSEQVVVETVPVVDQPNEAPVEVVEDDGPLDRLTVGALAPPEPESTYVPNSCDQ
jgi:hypothetical protein